MNTELILLVLKGVIDLLGQILRIIERYQGEIPPEVQEEVRKRIEEIRSGKLFDSPTWKPKP